MCRYANVQRLKKRLHIFVLWHKTRVMARDEAISAHANQTGNCLLNDVI